MERLRTAEAREREGAEHGPGSCQGRPGALQGRVRERPDAGAADQIWFSGALRDARAPGQRRRSSDRRPRALHISERQNGGGAREGRGGPLVPRWRTLAREPRRSTLGVGVRGAEGPTGRGEAGTGSCGEEAGDEEGDKAQVTVG